MLKKSKLIKIILIFFVLTIACIYSYFEFGAYFIFDRDLREEMVQQVSSAPQLPDRFIVLYGEANPGWNNSFLSKILFKPDSDCPSRDAVAYFDSKGYLFIK